MSKKALAIATGAFLLVAAIIGFATRSTNNKAEGDEWHRSRPAAHLPSDDWDRYDVDAAEDSADQMALSRQTETPLDRLMEMTRATEAQPVPPEPTGVWPAEPEADGEWGQDAEDLPLDTSEDAAPVEQRIRRTRDVSTPDGGSSDDPTENHQGDIDPTEGDYDDPGYDDSQKPEDENLDDDEFLEEEESPEDEE